MSTTDHRAPGPMVLHRLTCSAIAARLRLGTRAEAVAADQGFVLSPAQARSAGVDRAEQRRLVRHGSWTTVHYGVLSVLPPDAPGLAGLSPAIAAAAAVLVRANHVVSDESAAAMYGVPLLRTVTRPSLLATWRQAACDLSGIVVRRSALEPVDITAWHGAPATTLARTVCDLSRHSLRAGFVAAEAALCEGLLAHVELDDVIARQRGWPGVRAARAVAALADAGSESPLESLVRLFLHDRQVPLPRQQAWIVTDAGAFRVDGLWDERAVVLEVDGMVKYRRPMNPDEEDPLSAEKKRQEAIERAGYRVVRVTWEDLRRRPEQTLARIRTALILGGDRARKSRLQARIPAITP